MEEDYMQLLMYNITAIVPDIKLTVSGSHNFSGFNVRSLPIYTHNTTRPPIIPSTCVWEFTLDGQPYTIRSRMNTESFEKLLEFLTTKNESMVKDTYLVV